MPVDLSLSSTLAFLCILALGTYIQTNTGFAFALIVLSLASALDLVPVALLALLVSGLSMVNSTTALKGSHHHIDRAAIKALIMGCIPGALVGVWVLNQLSTHHQGALRIILGSSIIICGLLLMQKPQPFNQRSNNTVMAGTGLLGGIMGGMFAAFGPPYAFLLYRQPISIQSIRSTLLATFFLTAIIRIAMVAVTTGIPTEFYLLMSLGVPWIYLCTMLSRRFPPPVSEATLRRAAFGLLILSGLSLMMTGLKISL